MQISQQENNLSFLRNQLERFRKEHPEAKETVQDLLSNINLQLKQNAFNDFEKYFIEVHPDFYTKLKNSTKIYRKTNYGYVPCFALISAVSRLPILQVVPCEVWKEPAPIFAKRWGYRYKTTCLRPFQ
jgi:hypothetical protein